jgi:hypothetical protein
MDTRGILRPAAVDRVFGLQRTPPPADLAPTSSTCTGS